MKHVQRTPAGTWRYRRPVPLPLQRAVGRANIVRFLGKTEQEAIAAYAKVHAFAENLLERARGNVVVEPTEFEAHRSAVKTVRKMGFDNDRKRPRFEPEQEPDADWQAREKAVEKLARKYNPDQDEDFDFSKLVTLEDTMVARALIMSPHRQPLPTLDDARRLYLRERVGPHKAKTQGVDRVVGYVRKVMGKDPILEKITRLDARDVRDQMLDEINSPATVKRYLNTLRAIINFGIAEFDLNARNPFTGLEVKLDGVRKDDRRPFSAAEIEKARYRVLSHASADLQRVWRILQGTGCRVSEVTGLLVADVVLEHEHPHIDLAVHEHRRLKTAGSVRKVPLLGDALDAAREAVGAAGEHPALFRDYARLRGGDSASAALMKHVRYAVPDPKVTTHSLRHNMKDWLLEAGVSLDVRDLVLGQSSGAVSERYGGDSARLKVAHEALGKALAVALR